MFGWIRAQKLNEAERTELEAYRKGHEYIAGEASFFQTLVENLDELDPLVREQAKFELSLFYGSLLHTFEEIVNKEHAYPRFKRTQRED